MSRQDTPHAKRAAYFGTAGVSLSERRERASFTPPPPVPARVFLAELEHARSCTTSTLIHLDQAEALGVPAPATTPSILSAYAALRPEEPLVTTFQTGVEYWYVVEGEGTSTQDGHTIEWRAGDLFFLPGARPVEHRSAGSALLYVLTDQPLARFLRLGAAVAGAFEPVHYLGEDLRHHQQETYAGTGDSGVIHFGADGTFVYTSVLPTWKWMKPGEHQSPHRHAAVAVQLFLTEGSCWSEVDGRRVDWQAGAVAVSPAGSLHSHHNGGREIGAYLVAQDFPLYKYLRSYWHEEPETDVRLCDWLGQQAPPSA